MKLIQMELSSGRNLPAQDILNNLSYETGQIQGKLFIVSQSHAWVCSYNSNFPVALIAL